MQIHVTHYQSFNEEQFNALVELGKAVLHDQRLLLERTSRIMAQLDDLMAVLGAISNDVDSTLTEVSSLEQQLQDLQNNTPPSVDLQPAIDAAASIRQRLEGTQQTASDAAAPAAGDAQPATNFDEVAQPSGDGEATASPSVDGSEAGGEPTDGAPA